MTNPDQIDRSTHPTSPRQRQPIEHLWAIRKDGQQLDCELRDCGLWGVEGHHKTAYLQKGGILIA
jgi:hypothetical protein